MSTFPTTPQSDGLWPDDSQSHLGSTDSQSYLGSAFEYPEDYDDYYAAHWQAAGGAPGTPTAEANSLIDFTEVINQPVEGYKAAWREVPFELLQAHSSCFTDAITTRRRGCFARI